MRHIIWHQDDYFTKGEGELYEKIEMDPNVVELPTEPIPVTISFQFDRASIGEMVDVRLEDGHITGEVNWDPTEGFSDALIESDDLVFGGFYDQVEKTETEILSARLAGVGVLIHSEIPSRARKL